MLSVLSLLKSCRLGLIKGNNGCVRVFLLLLAFMIPLRVISAESWR